MGISADETEKEKVRGGRGGEGDGSVSSRAGCCWMLIAARPAWPVARGPCPRRGGGGGGENRRRRRGRLEGLTLPRKRKTKGMASPGMGGQSRSLPCTIALLALPPPPSPSEGLRRVIRPSPLFPRTRSLTPVRTHARTQARSFVRRG